MRVFQITAAATALALAGCVSMPTGPTLSALPGSGKNFDQFRADDASCRHYAYEAIGGKTPETQQQNAAVTSGVAGAALGALLGAAVSGGRGAAVGAGAGAAVGGLAGVGAGEVSGRDAQRRYDAAYVQCMYAQGHKVPVAAPHRYYAPAAQPVYVPPPAPPAGYGNVPPPPPPGAAPPPPPPGSAPLT